MHRTPTSKFNKMSLKQHSDKTALMGGKAGGETGHPLSHRIHSLSHKHAQRHKNKQQTANVVICHTNLLKSRTDKGLSANLSFHQKAVVHLHCSASSACMLSHSLTRLSHCSRAQCRTVASAALLLPRSSYRISLFFGAVPSSL